MARVKSREQLILELADLRKQIDELKRSETDCLFEEGLYRSLERSSRAGIYVLQDGKFRFVNEHAARYWGYNRNELIGMDSMSLVHPDHRAVRAAFGEQPGHGGYVFTHLRAPTGRGHCAGA